ncbi:DUF1844 domain-containing protein [Bradymonas sediminis]|uniref:Uncharacterized protein n=1 Tax=Bradymonas sediminis TaxID=1548548 RepID=A0A2Z4FR18_9DELT|nr:DUF1844 domain-containing protein [Bradymonas sediminis]AWV91449.1 hypothetical protein DN745_14545 [Bradymonas sediminis]TDP72130.1 uncharacterized protein DUF1844 [Bradymonas sediminis]
MSDDTTDQKSAKHSESAKQQSAADNADATVLGDNAGVHIPSQSKKANDPRHVPADFGSFVVSLGTNCMIHLGHIPHPETQQKAKDMASAKHTIDLLQMLREKTEGNLVDEEIKLINSLIYDLKTAYVQEKKAKN